MHHILETRLSMIGYTVVTAADGEEALTTFR
ncbi:DNA-binding response regulator, partial [Synechococcus sp. PCC 6716]|nr:DNA-binding response regulator [Synechococcus sp. PCC 6716]